MSEYIAPQVKLDGIYRPVIGDEWVSELRSYCQETFGDEVELHPNPIRSLALDAFNIGKIPLLDVAQTVALKATLDEIRSTYPNDFEIDTTHVLVKSPARILIGLIASDERLVMTRQAILEKLREVTPSGYKYIPRFNLRLGTVHNHEKIGSIIRGITANCLPQSVKLGQLVASATIISKIPTQL